MIKNDTVKWIKGKAIWIIENAKKPFSIEILIAVTWFTCFICVFQEVNFR